MPPARALRRVLVPPAVDERAGEFATPPSAGPFRRQPEAAAGGAGASAGPAQPDRNLPTIRRWSGGRRPDVDRFGAFLGAGVEVVEDELAASAGGDNRAWTVRAGPAIKADSGPVVDETNPGSGAVDDTCDLHT